MFAGDENYRGYDLRQKSSPVAAKKGSRRVQQPSGLSGGSNSSLTKARQSLRSITTTNNSISNIRGTKEPSRMSPGGSSSQRTQARHIPNNSLTIRGSSKRSAPAQAFAASPRKDASTRSQKKARALPQPPKVSGRNEHKTGGGGGASGIFLDSACTLLADFSYKALIQTSASWLIANVPIWTSQRPVCTQRVQEIVAKQQVRDTPRFQGVISIFQFAAQRSCLAVPQTVAIFDGQHRAKAIQALLEGGTPDFPVLLEVWKVQSRKEAVELFIEINRSQSVQEIDLP